MTKIPSQQTTIFSSGSVRQAFYAELCNALYDKSIQELAEHSSLEASTLKQRLASLTYHINLAAEKLINCTTPLDLDVYNGSWQGPQSKTCQADKANPDTTAKWLEKTWKLDSTYPFTLLKNDLNTLN